MKIKAILIITIVNLIVLMVICVNILTEVRAERMEKAESFAGVKIYKEQKRNNVEHNIDSALRASISKTDSVITAQRIEAYLKTLGIRVDSIKISKTKK